MKKLFVVIYCWVVALSCYSVEYPQSLFSDVVPENLPNYEFVIRNPLFMDKYYITDLSKVKGKILKTNANNYVLGDDGKKSWYRENGESDVTVYLQFDKKGRICKSYTIDKWFKGAYSSNETDLNIINLEERTLTFDQNGIYDETKKAERVLIGEKDEKTHKTASKTFNIIKTGKLIEVKKFTDTGTSRFFCRKGGLLEAKDNGIMPGMYEIWVYKNNECRHETYYGDTLAYLNITKNCEDVLSQNLDDNGTVRQQMESVEKGEGNIVGLARDKDGKLAKRLDLYLCRRFSPVGFLEYQEQRPLKNGSAGDYRFYNAKIIDDFDEQFKEHFNDKFYEQF